MPRPLEQGQYPADIVAPASIRCGLQTVQRERVHSRAQRQGRQPDRSVLAARGRRSHPDPAVNGHGQHKAFVIVCMFADQIDPAWRAEQARCRIAKDLAKSCADCVCHAHRTEPTALTVGHGWHSPRPHTCSVSVRGPELAVSHPKLERPPDCRARMPARRTPSRHPSSSGDSRAMSAPGARSDSSGLPA